MTTPSATSTHSTLTTTTAVSCGCATEVCGDSHDLDDGDTMESAKSFHTKSYEDPQDDTFAIEPTTSTENNATCDESSETHEKSLTKERSNETSIAVSSL